MAPNTPMGSTVGSSANSHDTNYAGMLSQLQEQIMTLEA
jgi:hypothetical protein